MPLVLMALGSWAGGFTACHLLLRHLRIDGGCPKCPKCWIGSVIAVAYWVGEYISLPQLKAGFSSPLYLQSVLFASLVGGAICLAICPIRSK